jgi:L1 cell adhesion molecule like protein
LDVNRHEAVVLGLARLAAVLDGENRDVLLVEVTALPIGLEGSSGQFTRVVPKGTTLPSRTSHIVSTMRGRPESIHLRVLQGEAETATGNETLFDVDVVGLTASAAGTRQIEIVFDIDGFGVLRVEARDVDTRRSLSLCLHGTGRPIESPVTVESSRERRGASRRCARCQAELETDDRFCGGCGLRV